MSGTPGQPALPTGAARWTVTLTVMLALFTYTLNTKSTVLQANQITQALALDRYKAQWITGPENVIGLVAIFAALHFMQVFGIRLLFIAGAACLTLGSVGTMLSQNGWQEAISGSVRSFTSLYAIPGLTLLMQMFPRRKGITYCTCLAFVYGGQVLAEPLGGLIAYNPSWRAGFGIIAVLGAWFVVCGWFLLPDDRPSRWPDRSFDWLGVLLFAAFLSLVLVLLYRGNYLGWWISTPIWFTAGGVCLALVLFIWRETIAGEPFINLRALSFRTVAVTTAAATFWSGALYGMAIQLPRYMLARGYDNWKVGWVMMPMGLVMLVTMIARGFARDRSRVVWNLRLGLLGMTLFGYCLAQSDYYTSWQKLMFLSTIWAVFAGTCLPSIGRLTYEGQQRGDAATTGAMKFFLRAFGAMLGVLIAGILLERGTAWGLDFVRSSLKLGQGALQVVEPAIRDHMVRLGSGPAEAEARAEATIGYWVNVNAEIIGYRSALMLSAYLSAIGLCISFCIHRHKEFSIMDDDD